MSWRETTRRHEPVAYFIGLALMAASLTLSPFMMTVAQLWLLAAWLFLGDPITTKLNRFIHSKTALLLVSLYLLHVVGLTYTSDFAYALKDLRVKLPLLVFPLILSSVKPLEKKYADLLLLVYVAAVLVATGMSFTKYVRHDFENVRKISRYISHIRFCLNIVLATGITGYYLFTRKMQWWEKSLCLAVMAWFVLQLYVFESISGYLAFLGMTAVSVLYVFFSRVKSIGWKVAGIIVVAGLPLLAGILFFRTARTLLAAPKVDIPSLEKKTALGNDYWHDTVSFPIEDGHYVGLYFCRPEMREAWNRRSELDYDGLTRNGENLEATLARYLTSKGLRKDAAGVESLDEQDLRNVEQGIANYVNWTHPGVYARLSETLFEYNQYRRRNNPNGGSLSQRLEYTKASIFLIKQHPLFGVGTGDIPIAYQEAYNELQSPLEPQYRHKAHNQYLSITVGLGIIGLVLFLLVLFTPYLSKRQYRTYFYTIFLAILLISMFPEDTIESQAGASFYAFFNSLFIFAFKNREKNPIHTS